MGFKTLGLNKERKEFFGQVISNTMQGVKHRCGGNKSSSLILTTMVEVGLWTKLFAIKHTAGTNTEKHKQIMKTN